MKGPAVLASLLLLGSYSFAAVGVRIADYPASVLRYSPVLITARIENLGGEPVLVPASDRTDCRYFVEVGRSPETLAEFRLFDGTGMTGAVVWLKPGGSWLFQTDIGPWLHEIGSYVIRAGVTSSGACPLQTTGTGTFPLKVIEKRQGYEVYECWSGRAVSDVATIEIREPDAAVDRDALTFIRSPDFPVDGFLENRFHLRLQFGATNLLERFPTSHYTFVAGFYAGQKSPEFLEHLADLQPAHPLVPYARFSSVLARLRSNPATVSAGRIQALDLPVALKDYLAQERANGNRGNAP